MSAGDDNSGLIHSVDETPPLWLTIVLGLQHVLLIYGEIAVFPLLIGKAAGAPQEHIQFACFGAGLAAGLCTLLQVFRLGAFGSGYALFMGSSAAYFAGSVEVLKAGGFPLLAGISILVAPVEMLFAYFLRFFRHIATPAVGGTVLLLIVMNLVPVGLDEWVGVHGGTAGGSEVNFLAGLVTLVTLLGLGLFGGKALRLWCPILGLGAGLASAWWLGLLKLESTAMYPWIGIAGGQWPGLDFGFKGGAWHLIATMGVLTLVNGIQALGNSMAVQQVSQRAFRRIDYERVQGTMYADAVGNLVSGALGTVPNETYCENISVLKITGVASRAVAVCGGLMLIGLSFSPKVGMFIAQMPPPVFGGFMMGLAAMMFPSGLSLVFAHGITHQSGLMVGISLCLGMAAESKGFFPGLFPSTLDVFLQNGVAAGGLVAFVLSALFYLAPKKGQVIRLALSPERLTRLMNELEALSEKLKLAPEVVFNLQLACEEVFVHLLGEAEQNKWEGRVAFKVHKEEHAVAVEAICGKAVDEVDEAEMPMDLLASQDEELDRMGLALLHKVAGQVRHLEISGVTYLSFRVPLAAPAARPGL